MNQKISPLESRCNLEFDSKNQLVAGSAAKARYEAPQLTIYGRLRELTLQLPPCEPGQTATASGAPCDTGVL